MWHKETHRIMPGWVGPRWSIGAGALLRLCQDVADRALARGSSAPWSLKDGLGWMTHSYRARLIRPLLVNEEITVATACAPLKDLYSWRRFIFLQNDVMIGQCDSTWLLVDRKTRRIKRLSRALDQATLNFFEPPFQDQPLPDEKFIDEEGTVQTVELRSADLDGNGHVNNSVYPSLFQQGLTDHWDLLGFDLFYRHETHHSPLALTTLELSATARQHRLHAPDGTLVAEGRTLWQP